MSDRRGEVENSIDEEVQSPTPPNDFLFLAGRFWGRDEVARTGFPGLVLEAIGYVYVSLSFLLILNGYQNSRPFTFWTAFLAIGGVIWALNIYTARNMRRDSDRKILEDLGITIERKEKPVGWRSWICIKLGWEAPPAGMTLSRGDTPFLSIDQGLAGSLPTVRLLGDTASIQKQPSLAAPDVVPPVEAGHLTPDRVDAPVTGRL